MADDAWKQHHDLMEKFTREFKPRADLRVVGQAAYRTVVVGIGESTKLTGTAKEMHPYDWHETTRNVSTMRELAEAILAACDFVEQSNPVWASRG